MSRTRLRFLVGCSLALSLASSRLLKKITTKQKKITSSKQDLMKLYLGEWQFIDPKTDLEHTIGITNDLNLTLNHSSFKVTTITLTQEKLMLRDLYGYHLTFYHNEEGVTHFYDEANDHCYRLSTCKKNT